MPEVTQGVNLTGMLWYWAFAYFYYIIQCHARYVEIRNTL